MRFFLLFILFVPVLSIAQPLNIKKTQGGILSCGVRTTISTFNGADASNIGTGFGGEFRLQLSNRINTEWFADYITGNVGSFASRTDYHIGWSVMYYFTDKMSPRFKPFIVAGHCFDGSELVDNSNVYNKMSKKSSAVQMGGGFHFNLSDRMDLTFNTQYMIHLGADVHAHVHEGEVEFEKHQGSALEGHLLFHIGVNYKIADLW